MIGTGIARAIGAEVAGLSYNLSDGGNVFEEHLPADPDVVVGVYTIPGREADTLHPYDSPGVQLIIRGDTNPLTAVELWYLLYDYLHGKRNVSLPDGTYLVWAIATQSAPVRIGPDSAGRHQFSLNLRCETRRTSTHRPA